MSIANLPFVPQVDLQNLFLDGNARPGLSGKLIMGNDDLSGFTVPNDLYIMETLPTTDPTAPGGFLLSYQSASPSPVKSIALFDASGGSGVGNGSIVAIPGDLTCEGLFVPSSINFSNLNAGTAVIDSSSNLISQPLLGGKLNNSWLFDNNFGGDNLGGPNDNSWAVIDPFNREVRLYINTTWKVAGVPVNNPLNLTIKSTNNYTQVAGTLPGPNQAFQGYLPSNTAPFFFNNLTLINYSAGPTTFIGGLISLASYNATNGNFTIVSQNNCSLSPGDELVLTGFISYPY